jgi:serine/threonine protein kinase
VDPDRSRLGAQLGSYTILSRLGAGGMGEVYRAHDTKLGRDVALKVLARDLADDPERGIRLLREARAAASLNHPNICTIYEVGETEGLAYIAMEVVEGEPLSSRLHNGPLPSHEVVRYGLQLADALAHAHERGIVHRDLKSANVMVTPEGRIKVLDFGLAKRMPAAALSDVATRSHHSLTMPGTILGTLPYMAPEQLRGQPADARSDVWALGVVLYEMAAGARPFEGQTGFELSSVIFHQSPPPLSSRVPAPLQAVTMRCLEKEPAQRYQGAKELRAALELVESSDDVRASAPASATRLRWYAAALVAVAAVAGAVLWLNVPNGRQPTSGTEEARIRSIAVMPLENLSGDSSEEYFVNGMHEALITDLARIGLQKVIAKPSADVFKGTKKPLRDIGRELGVAGLITGSVLRVGNRIRVTAQLVRADSGAIVWANKYEHTDSDVLTLQNELVGAIAREVRATLTPEQATRLATPRPVSAAAHDAYLKGRSVYATFVNSTFDRQLLDSTLTEFQRSIKIDPTYAPPHAALSATYLAASQSSLLPPNDVFPKAKAAALTAVELDDTLPAAHAALGDVELWYGWNWETAEREIQRALQLNPDSTDALRAFQNFATLVAARFDEANRASQRILDLDPLNPFSRLQTIWVSFFSRRHEDSISRARSFLEVWPTNIMGPYFLAANYAVKQMGPETRIECDKLMEQLAGAYVMRLIGQCVWAHAVVGQTDQARRLLQRLRNPPEGIWLDPAVMAQAYAGLDDIDRAVQWTQKAIDARSPTIIYLKAGAHFDRARGDPRFQALLRQMNFPQ